MIVSSAGRADGWANAEGVAQFKTQFAFNHLQVAVKAAVEAHHFEPQDLGQQIGPWFEGVLQTVPVAIVMSAAALEANANEIIDDFLEGRANLERAVDQNALRKLKEDRKGNFVGRHRDLAKTLGKVRDCRKDVWADACLLTEFRNLFMHFRPAMSDCDDDKNFFTRMSEKVPVVEAYKDHHFGFPHALMTCACARWAVKTAKEFSADFSDVTGVADRFASLDPKLP
jgi:hypothetical protein